MKPITLLRLQIVSRFLVAVVASWAALFSCRTVFPPSSPDYPPKVVEMLGFGVLWYVLSWLVFRVWPARCPGCGHRNGTSRSVKGEIWLVCRRCRHAEASGLYWSRAGRYAARHHKREQQMRDYAAKCAETVVGGCSWEATKQFKCPVCNAPITVNFHPSGGNFAVYCSENIDHVPRTCRTMDRPPNWWQGAVVRGTWKDVEASPRSSIRDMKK